jgi:hypothetical protein
MHGSDSQFRLVA